MEGRLGDGRDVRKIRGMFGRFQAKFGRFQAMFVEKKWVGNQFFAFGNVEKMGV